MRYLRHLVVLIKLWNGIGSDVVSEFLSSLDGFLHQPLKPGDKSSARGMMGLKERWRLGQTCTTGNMWMKSKPWIWWGSMRCGHFIRGRTATIFSVKALQGSSAEPNDHREIKIKCHNWHFLPDVRILLEEKIHIQIKVAGCDAPSHATNHLKSQSCMDQMSDTWISWNVWSVWSRAWPCQKVKDPWSWPWSSQRPAATPPFQSASRSAPHLRGHQTETQYYLNIKEECCKVRIIKGLRLIDAVTWHETLKDWDMPAMYVAIHPNLNPWYPLSEDFISKYIFLGQEKI